MKLAIFEVDGTLTQRNDVDRQCFVQAFADEFGITGINTDWAMYGHTTNSGIALQIFQEQLGRSPKPGELQQLRDRFVHLLQEVFVREDRLFVPIAGAAAMLLTLRQAGWAIGVATGEWCMAAHAKLAHASLVNEFPSATADDGISREEIMTRAIEAASWFYRQARFESVVCVGASVWDAMTAAQLNLPFVGVGSDGRRPGCAHRSTLQDLDVQTVENFEDCDRFLQALQTATVPSVEKLLNYQQQIFQGKSLPPSYFEALYAAKADPWSFETSPYEAEKYAATIAALPKQRYRSAFEIGGSIGVLTEKLADRCDDLLSVDVSVLAQQRAIDRCQLLPHVRFQIMNVPIEYPDEMFDLVIVSEVGYYWSWDALWQAQQRILQHLEPGGHLLLVHWTEYARDYPLSGHDVHQDFLDRLPTSLQHLLGQQEAQYRLDLFERI